MDAAVIVLHEDEKLRLVASGGVLLAHVRLRFTHEESVAIHGAQEYLRSTVGRHGIIVVVSDVRAELSERARKFSRRTSAEFADWVVCVAHVIEPRGFVGAAVRCVMAGMRAINKPPYPMREFASTRGAALWTTPLLVEAGIELPFSPEPDAMLEWVEHARAPDLFDTGRTSAGSVGEP
ncbi:MAG: hypothetical protein R6X02_19875 [Enhygromyxa sp.]